MTGNASAATPTSRREMLIGLAVLAPLAAFVGPSVAIGAGEDRFMTVSRTLTGNDRLSAAIGARIEDLLAKRVNDFGTRLAGLADALQRGGQRDAAIASLDPAQVATAVEIAKPWYLGWVGTPSSTILKDDAAFATFIEAQSFDKIIDVVPRPTYPGHSAGWWSTPPPGVTAPPMPADILSWTFDTVGQKTPRTPDPRWRAYAAATFASIDDARKAKP